MSAAAGWYADPSGVQGQLRWWDGERWTDHVTPDPNAANAATAPVETPDAGASARAAAAGTTTVTDTRTDDGSGGSAGWVAGGAAAAGGWAGGTSPADATPATGETSQPPPPTGPPLDQQPAAGGHPQQAAWGNYQGSPSWQTDVPPATSSSTVKTGLIVAAIVGVAVLAIIAALIFGLIGATRGSGEFIDDGFFDDAPSSTIDVGVISPGGSVDGTIPEDGMLTATLVVERPGPVTIDVRGTDDFDGMLELIDENGGTIAENDDRDVFGEGRVFDPLIETELDPGRYTIQVRGWAGEGGSFELSVD